MTSPLWVGPFFQAAAFLSSSRPCEAIFCLCYSYLPCHFKSPATMRGMFLLRISSKKVTKAPTTSLPRRLPSCGMYAEAMAKSSESFLFL